MLHEACICAIFRPWGIAPLPAHDVFLYVDTFMHDQRTLVVREERGSAVQLDPAKYAKQHIG